MIISFQAWPELLKEIEARCPEDEKPHSVARRDLVRYYAAIAATQKDVFDKISPQDLTEFSKRFEFESGCAALTGIDSRRTVPPSIRELSDWEYMVLVDYCERAR